MLDIQSIRKDFPMLEREVYGHPLIYLDNAATTQKPRCVVESLVDGYYHGNANVHRGVHFLSQQATEAHEGAREEVRRFLGARKSSEIIFTRGTTEAINMLASSYGRAFMKPGDEVIISAMEHHSNIVPWQLQEMCLRVISLTDDGELDMEGYEKLFSEKTRLVSVTHISNVLGTVNPVAEIIRIAHAHGVPVLIDGAQAVAHRKVDVAALDVDFYAFSGHKIYAPTGIGVLYGKASYLEQMPPYQGGGEMIASVTFEKTTFNELPYKFEAGTPDFIGSTALAAALRYLSAFSWEDIAQHEQALFAHATRQLEDIPNLRIFGKAQERSGVISFALGDIHHYDLGLILDRLGIAVRTGHHCAEPLMRILGVEGTTRASFALYNTLSDVDIFVAGLRRAGLVFEQKKK